MLKRAQRIRSQEDLVLPLYEPLAKSAAEGDFRAPIFSVLCGLAMASDDAMWEKLAFIIRLFDVNDNKVRIHRTQQLFSLGCFHPSLGLLEVSRRFWREQTARYVELPPVQSQWGLVVPPSLPVLSVFLFATVHGQGRDMCNASYTRQCIEQPQAA